MWDLNVWISVLKGWSCSVAVLCPILWDPMDCSLPDFSVCGILQARILEWVAMASSWSLFRFMPIELVMPSNHLTLCCPLLLLPSVASGSFPVNWLFTSGGQSSRALASASVLPINIQGWSPLGLTGMISLFSKGLSRVFSSTTVQKLWFFSTQPALWSNSHICTWLLEKP